MRPKPGITVAVCTRNRSDDVDRCIRSIAREAPGFPVETLVVDDGETPENRLLEWRGILTAQGMTFRYLKKRRPGLLYSRIEAAERAAHDVILFLDDDAEAERGYLKRLAGLYYRYPQAAGIGGVDARIRSSFKWDCYTRLFLYDSGNPGKLSPSGYGGSMTRWGKMKTPFRTEYLLGCNMSFRRSALAGLPPAEWLSGYGLGEDLYVSDWAMRSGTLWVDPKLRVVHHQSPASRDKEELVAFSEIANHYRLLRAKRAGPWRYAVHLWTSLGLYGRALARRRLRHKAAAYRKAIRFVLAEHWRRLFRESVSDLGNGRPLR